MGAIRILLDAPAGPLFGIRVTIQSIGREGQIVPGFWGAVRA